MKIRKLLMVAGLAVFASALGGCVSHHHGHGARYYDSYRYGYGYGPVTHYRVYDPVVLHHRVDRVHVKKHVVHRRPPRAHPHPRPHRPDRARPHRPGRRHDDRARDRDRGRDHQMRGGGRPDRHVRGQGRSDRHRERAAPNRRPADERRGGRGRGKARSGGGGGRELADRHRR